MNNPIRFQTEQSKILNADFSGLIVSLIKETNTEAWIDMGTTYINICRKLIYIRLITDGI